MDLADAWSQYTHWNAVCMAVTCCQMGLHIALRGDDVSLALDQGGTLLKPTRRSKAWHRGHRQVTYRNLWALSCRTATFMRILGLIHSLEAPFLEQPDPSRSRPKLKLTVNVSYASLDDITLMGLWLVEGIAQDQQTWKTHRLSTYVQWVRNLANRLSLIWQHIQSCTWVFLFPHMHALATTGE